MKTDLPTHPILGSRAQSTQFAKRRSCHGLRPSRVEQLERRLCLTAAFTAINAVDIGSMADFVDVADFNHDGKFDFVVSSYAGGGLGVALGNGDGTFQALSDILLTSAPDHVVIGDVNADGHADLITTSYDNNNVGVLLGNGNGTFQSAVYYSAGTGPRMVVLGDFTGDGKLDIAVGKSFAKTLTILRNNGNGTFQSPLNTSLSITPVDLAVGDFNNDGKLDLAAADFATDKVAILLGNGNATFQAATTYTTAAGPASIAVADFNADGKLDVATANYLASNVSLLLGNGNGTLQSAVSWGAGSGATYVEATDLDGDGSIDLAIANANADTVTLRFNNGSAGFSNTVSYSVGQSPRSIAVGNFNAGGIDLAVANQDSSDVCILAGDASAVAPTANPGGPYSVNEGSTVQLSGSGTGTDLTYVWDLDGDGVFGETGSSAKRGNEVGANPVFSAVGVDGPDSRTVRLRVTSSNGLSDTQSAVVWIQNVAPTLSISGAASANEGSTYTLSLSSSDPGPDTISSWLITWGDGTTSNVSGNPSSVTHVFADNGNYTISATATDEDGTYSSNTKGVAIANVAPSLTISGASSQVLGSDYTLSLSATDPGADTIISWTIHWGDGTTSVVGNVSSAIKLFASEGNYTITATASDEDGTYIANSKQVSVFAAPNAIPGGPYFVAEGSTVQLSGSASTGSGLSYAWDLDGDGVYGETGAAAKRGNETGATPVFSAANIDGPDSRTVRLRVTDSRSLTSTSTAIVWIQNVAPTLSVSGASAAIVGSAYTLQLGASDPGADTISSWLIDWGDGTTSQVSGSASSAGKVYSAAGSYSIVATATDEDGSYDSDPVAVDVSVVDSTGPSAALTWAPSITSPDGTTYSFQVTYNDDSGVDGSTLDSADVLVTGPGGFSQIATRLSAVSGSAGSYVVTYQIGAAGGTWDWTDNGSYTVALRAWQVRDVNGNYAAAGSIGSWETAIIPPDTAGNRAATARTLSRQLGAGIVRAAEDIVGPLDTDDYFRIYFPERLDVTFKVHNLTDNADLWLYDGNGNLMLWSTRAGLTYEYLSTTLDAGKYYVRVNYAGSDIGGSYRLRVAATLPIIDPGLASAADLGALSSGAVSVSTGNISVVDQFDYYRFIMPSASSIYAKLTNMADNLDLQILDSAGNVVGVSASAGNVDEGIRLNLSAGTYYVRLSLAGSAGSTYRLRLANVG